MNDQIIKLILQLTGTSDVKDAVAALQGLQNQGPQTAVALTQAEDATKQAAAAAKALADEEREAIVQVKAAEAAAKALADANAKVNAALAKDQAIAAAQELAAANREAAEAAEMVAAAERHESEMARAAAAAEREEVEALRQVAAAEKQVAAANEAVAAASARVNAAFDAEAAEAQQLTTALGAEANALRATDAAQDQLGASGVVVGKGMGSLQQSIIAGSYAFQDFTATSGDFGAKLNSVSNNLPGLLIGLGGLGVALSVGATAGIAIYRNWDSIAGLWETRNPFPKAANDVSGLKRELEAAKSELEKMDKAGVGNAVQLARYNELRTRTAEIEKEIAAAQERQAQIKKLFEAPTASEAEAQKERVELLGEIRGPTARQLARDVAGVDNAEVEARVAEGAKAKVAAENERLRAQQAELDWQTQAREVEAIDVTIAQTDARVLAQMKADKAKLEAAAETMVAEATLEGKIGPFRQIQKAMAERPEDFRHEQVRTFAQAAPEALKEDQDFAARMEALTETGKRRRERAAAAKKADDAADKVIADDLRDKLDIIKGIGGIDQAADELTKATMAKGLKGADAFAQVKEGLDESVRGALQLHGFQAPAGREDVVDAQVGDLATQAAKAARIRAGVAEGKAEKKEDKGEQAGIMAEARANQASIDAQVKKITATVGPEYKKEFEAIMATNAGNAAMGRPSVDRATLGRQLERQMYSSMRRRGADPQSANLAAKGIATAGTTDLAKQFESKSGTVAQKNLQLAADHNRLFAAVIGQMNGLSAEQANVSRTTTALLHSVHPRAQHQRRIGQN